MYELTCQRASLEPPAPQMSQLLAALRGNQHDTDRLIGVLLGTVPVPEFFAPGNIQRIKGAAGTSRLNRRKVSLRTNANPGRIWCSHSDIELPPVPGGRGSQLRFA